MKTKNTVLVLVAAVSSLTLAACTVTTPSQVKTGQIELRQDVAVSTLDAQHVDQGKVAALARDYLRNGRGGMKIVFSHLEGQESGKLAAEKQARVYRQAFAAEGVSDIDVSFAPTPEQEFSGQVIVSYAALGAHPPSGCAPITGRDGGGQLDEVSGYSFGCETKSALSRMIAYPQDLLGTDAPTQADSRRSGSMVEPYRSGTPNEPFDDAMSASSLGQ